MRIYWDPLNGWGGTCVLCLLFLLCPCCVGAFRVWALFAYLRVWALVVEFSVCCFVVCVVLCPYSVGEFRAWALVVDFRV